MKQFYLLLPLAFWLCASTGYGLSVDKEIAHLKAECQQAKAAFGTQDLKFRFTNYSGQIQESVTKVTMTSLNCVSNGEEYSFDIERTTDPKMSVNVYAAALGGSTFRVNPKQSSCLELAYPNFKEKLIQLGVVWTGDFEIAFQKNLAEEYCPSFKAAVRDKLIEILQEL